MSEKSALLAASVLVAAVAMGTSGVAQAGGDMEKCYGVAKAGMNDCGNASHACAGQSTDDGEKTEWIYMPEGTCAKIVNGSTS